MIGCVDVHYRDDRAVAALVLCNSWTSCTADETHIEILASPAVYEPGNFFKRELPCILAVLDKCSGSLPETIIIDGYVWLNAIDEESQPGLGAHLFQALENGIAVVGVAKTKFKDSHSIPVLRGGSKRPLFVTAAGIDLEAAAKYVEDLHGDNRIPTIIKLADSLARSY